MAPALKRNLPFLGGVALLLLLWSGLTLLYPPILAPSPQAVLSALAQLAASGSLWRELSITLLRLAAAFSLGALLGLSLGLIAGLRPALAALLRPGMAVAGGVPPISWLALALIWFGTGSLAPITVALLVATPVVFLATAEGVRALDPDLLLMARAYGLRGPDLLRQFYLPALTPHLITGLSAGAGLTVRVGVMGEFLASDSGIGSAMALARSRLDTAQVVAWVTVALALLLLSEALLLRPLARRAQAWRGEG